MNSYNIVIAAGNDALFQKLCTTLGHPALAEDERCTNNHLRTDHAEALKQEIERVLKEQDSKDRLEKLDEARNMVIDIHDPVAGLVKMPGNPIKLSAFADPKNRKPAPELDTDREAILNLCLDGA